MSLLVGRLCGATMCEERGGSVTRRRPLQRTTVAGPQKPVGNVRTGGMRIFMIFSKSEILFSQNSCIFYRNFLEIFEKSMIQSIQNGPGKVHAAFCSGDRVSARPHAVSLFAYVDRVVFEGDMGVGPLP